MEQVSTLAADPGPPPRRIGIGELFKRLPAFLQIGTVVTPVCALIAIVWITIDQSKEAFRVTLVGIWVLPLAYCWALMYRWRFVNYTPIRGNISRFAQGTGGMSGATIVHYRYDVGSVPFAGEYMLANPSGLVVGQEIWVLISPTNPAKSIAWFDLERSPSIVGGITEKGLEGRVVSVYNNGYGAIACRVLVVLACLLLIASGMWLFFSYTPNEFIPWVLGLCLIFFGMLAFLCTMQFTLSPMPYLVLNAEGIHVKQQTVELIPWNEVKGGDLVIQHGMIFLMLRLVNPERIAKSKVLVGLKELAEYSHFEEIKPLAADTLPIPLFTGKEDRERILEIVLHQTKTIEAETL